MQKIFMKEGPFRQSRVKVQFLTKMLFYQLEREDLGHSDLTALAQVLPFLIAF